MQKSTSLKYELSLELLLITAKQLFSNRELYRSVQFVMYRGTLLIRNSTPVAPVRSSEGFAAWGLGLGHRCSGKLDIRLPGKGNSNSHGAMPVHQILR